MPTFNNTVKTWLSNALLQLGAESYLHNDLRINQTSILNDQRALIDRLKFGFNDPTHSYIDTLSTGNSGTPMLPAYNRMVETQAREFLGNYEVIDHHANDATGFSATLYKSKSGEYILSARSTEFRKRNSVSKRNSVKRNSVKCQTEQCQVLQSSIPPFIIGESCPDPYA